MAGSRPAGDLHCLRKLLAGGGDGHYVFTALEKEDSTVLAADVLARYIEQNSPLNPVVDGRITVKGL